MYMYMYVCSLSLALTLPPSPILYIYISLSLLLPSLKYATLIYIVPGVFILDGLVLGAVLDVLAGCLVLSAAGVIALTSRLNSDWLDDIGVAMEPAPSIKFLAVLKVP